MGTGWGEKGGFALFLLCSDFPFLFFFFFAFFMAPIFLFYERETAGFSQGWEEHLVPGCSQPDGGEKKGGSGPIILGGEFSLLKRIGDRV